MFIFLFLLCSSSRSSLSHMLSWEFNFLMVILSHKTVIVTYFHYIQYQISGLQWWCSGESGWDLLWTESCLSYVWAVCCHCCCCSLCSGVIRAAGSWSTPSLCVQPVCFWLWVSPTARTRQMCSSDLCDLRSLLHANSLPLSCSSCAVFGSAS